MNPHQAERVSESGSPPARLSRELTTTPSTSRASATSASPRFYRGKPWSPTIRQCATCGADVQRAPAHLARYTEVFCGRACQRQGLLEHHPRRKPKVMFVCERCGKTFGVPPSRLKQAPVRFCSRECKDAAKSERAVPHFDPCAECGVLIQIRPGRIGTRNFCSRRCANLAHRVYVRGKTNGRYVDGSTLTLYPPGFPKSVRRSIKQRDGWACVVCGRGPKYLQVHHIDGGKTNHDPTNLVSLCIACHRKGHSKAGLVQAWMDQHGLLLLNASQRPMPSTTSV